MASRPLDRSGAEARLQHGHHDGHHGPFLVVELTHEAATLQSLGSHRADARGLDRAVGLCEPLQHERLHTRSRELDREEKPHRASAGDDDVVSHAARIAGHGFSQWQSPSYWSCSSQSSFRPSRVRSNMFQAGSSTPT
jgi:hypothetical protein